MKSIYVDWTELRVHEEWIFVGRQVLEEKKGEWSEDNPEGIECDDGYPMFNYAYPLYRDDLSEETILRVCEETSCTVVFNNRDDKYYLALTGCGMDLSQDIALAYLIADGCIDWDMLEDVYISGPLSVSRDDYLKLLMKLDEQLGVAAGNLQIRQNEVRKRLQEFKTGK